MRPCLKSRSPPVHRRRGQHQERADPGRQHRPVVGLRQTGHRLVRQSLRDARPPPALDQGRRILRLKLRMALERHRIVPRQPRIRRECAPRDHPRIGGRRQHLILMRHRNGDRGRTREHPRLLGQDPIAVQPHAPALVGLLDPPAEGVGHHLVPEADADQPRPPPRRPQPLDQRRDPRQVVIDPRRRAGDDGPLERLGIVRQPPGLNVEPHGLHALAQQGPEPRRIVVERILQGLGRFAGFQDRDRFHPAIGTGPAWRDKGKDATARP